MHIEGTTAAAYDDVVIVRWPEQRADAERLARLHRPHLMLVEASQPPPALEACLADWIRMPATDTDVRARLLALAARARRHPAVPTVDEFGEITFRGKRTFLSPTDQRLAEALVDSFDRAISDARLFEHIWGSEGDAAKVRVHVSRLRKRIQPLGLEITALRGVGYRLHAAHANAAVSAE
jgi:hypothetical protein